MEDKNLQQGDKIVWVPWGSPDEKYRGVLEDYDEESDSWHILWDDGYNKEAYEYWPAGEIYPLDKIEDFFS